MLAFRLYAHLMVVVVACVAWYLIHLAVFSLFPLSIMHRLVIQGSLRLGAEVLARYR